MPLYALALVIFAAVTHASWNLLAKHAARARHFVWFYSVVSVVLWTLPAAYFLVHQPPTFSPGVVIALVATGVLHLAYSESLQRGYRAADLSVVYPIARGTGPLLSFTGAALLLHEDTTWLAIVGVLMVVGGVFVIAGGTRLFAKDADHRGLAWGVWIGVLIASYTLNDGYAAKDLAIAPLLIDYTGNAFRCVVFLPRVWRDRHALRAEWHRYRVPALGVAVLGPLGYVLVLYAMTVAPISHVAPVRELSMMIGAYLGARIFHEESRRARVLASLCVALGVVALTVR